MDIHSIHTTVTRKIYSDIWRNIKNQPSEFFPILFLEKVFLPKVNEKLCFKIGLWERRYYFIRKDTIYVFH